MDRYLVELIGTFFLVLTIGNVVLAPGVSETAPLAVGSVLIALVYAGGHISGAHYNPAITIAFFLRGRFDRRDIAPYLIAQVVAAVAAAGAVVYLKGPEVVVSVLELSGSFPQAALAEILFTFLLAFVILNVATAKGTHGNSYYGLAIGLTVLAGGYAVGEISGGVFNPAVAVGLSFMGLSSWGSLWLYLVSNFAGAILAAWVFNVVHGRDGESTSGRGGDGAR